MSCCIRSKVKGITRPHPIAIVSPSDFELEDPTELDAAEVLRDPKYTLYCFDPENRAVHFVESDDPLAVDRAPFYYQAQVEHAIGLVSMPLETFHTVAKQIPPMKVIFVPSVGRCGSTLMSKLFEAIPTVHSLSEPDDLTQMVNLRTGRFLPDDYLQDCLASSVRWRGKARTGSPAEFVAIKPRSEVMVLADLLGPSFAGAKHLFLYRNGIAWMQTLFKGIPLDVDVYDEERNRKSEAAWSRTLPLVRDSIRDDAPMNPVQVRILAWITCMEGYLNLAAQGLPVRAVRFEDLTATPLPILEQIFEFCDIKDVDWQEMQAVLGRDSQAGTIFDREERRKFNRELTDALVKDLEESIASHPKLGAPDVVLPWTITPPE